MSSEITADKAETVERGLPGFVWKLFIGLLLLALISGGILVFGHFYGAKLRNIGHSANPTPLEIVIGNDVFSIPTNMIRHPDERVAGVTGSLSLFVHWPTQGGYRDSLANAFHESDPDTIDIAFINLNRRKSLLDMAERFDVVYQQAFNANNVRSLGNGLYSARLASELGYINEKLIFSRADGGSRPKFIARCQAAPDETSRLLLPCETDIFVGNSTSAKIRFAISQLSRWEQFSNEIKVLLKKLRV